MAFCLPPSPSLSPQPLDHLTFLLSRHTDNTHPSSSTLHGTNTTTWCTKCCAPATFHPCKSKIIILILALLIFYDLEHTLQPQSQHLSIELHYFTLHTSPLVMSPKHQMHIIPSQ